MLEDVLNRFTPMQRHEINEFFRVLAFRTRKSKRISESRKENILRSWEKYDAEVVIDGINTFVKMATSAEHDEKYVGGIIRNKQRSKEMSGIGRNTGRINANKNSNGFCGEGERLKIGKIRDTDLECGF